MALQNFKPQIWAARLQYYLDKALVYGSPMVVNRDYEGQIRAFGDTVKINQVGPITVSDYTANSNISSAQTLTDAQTLLIIDQAKYFHFQIDDVDAAQTNPKVMDTAMQRASYALADAIDQNIAAHMAANATANGIGTVGSPKTDLGTAGKARQYIREAKTKMDEANAPTTGRFLIMPPWYAEKLGLDTVYLVGTGTPQSEQRVASGVVERLDGFDLMVSNNVPSTNTTTAFQLVFGVNLATTLAYQIIETEAYRPELRFAEAVKGLTVFGRKVTLPTALGMIVANRP